MPRASCRRCRSASRNCRRSGARPRSGARSARGRIGSVRNGMRAFAFVLSALLTAPVLVARADDVGVHAEIEPTQVEVGGQAMLTIVVEGKFRRGGGAPELPPLNDFDV